MTVNPRKTQRTKTWTDSTMGYTRADSWSAMLRGVFATHSQK